MRKGPRHDPQRNLRKSRRDHAGGGSLNAPKGDRHCRAEGPGKKVWQKQRQRGVASTRRRALERPRRGLWEEGFGDTATEEA